MYYNATEMIYMYTEIRHEMLIGLTGSHCDWTNLIDAGIETSWLDVGNVLSRIGDFISGIFD